MTALISVIPILLLIVLMMGFKVSGYKSAIITLVVTIFLALFAVPAMGIIPEKYSVATKQNAHRIPNEKVMQMFITGDIFDIGKQMVLVLCPNNTSSTSELSGWH